MHTEEEWRDLIEDSKKDYNKIEDLLCKIEDLEEELKEFKDKSKCSLWE